MNQRTLDKTMLVLGAMLCAMMLGGCNSQSGVTATPGVVPLKVWVVLGPGENVGNIGNSGCRLSQAQMIAYVKDIQRSGGMFGNAKFTWNGVVNPSVDNSLTGLGPQRIVLPLHFVGWSVPDFHDDSFLNIYFTGWIENDPTPTGPEFVRAATVDPADVNSWTPPIKPFIFINDGGANRLSGFDVTPESLLTETLTHLHEMAHFLGRFEGDCYGIPILILRCYDMGEHTDRFSQNILSIAVRGDTRTGVVPDWPVAIGEVSEFKQIESRVAGGLWNHQ